MDNIELAKKILAYWYTMEFLQQDAFVALSVVDKKKLEQAKNLIKDIRKSDQVPNGDAKNKPVKVLKILNQLQPTEDIVDKIKTEASTYSLPWIGRLTIYGGKIKREACIQEIIKALRTDDPRPEQNYDKIAVFSLQVENNGAYCANSFSLSPVIWAMNKIQGIHTEVTSSANLQEESYRQDIHDYEEKLQEQKIISTEYVLKLATAIEEKYLQPFTIIKDNIQKQIYLSYQLFKSQDIAEAQEDDDYSGLHRSFFSQDLCLVAEQLVKHPEKFSDGMLKSLLDYIVGVLQPKELSKERINLIPEPGHRNQYMETYLAELLDVANAPLGKWPSRYMPALMQQAAINLFTNQDKSQEVERIFSVNGPPGTGKTTLLKEIIVYNIVERAKLLADYESPDTAFEDCKFQFGPHKENSYSDIWYRYFRLKNDAINDYSMLVTSCNNAAVENITKELPDEKAILESLKADKYDSEEIKKQLETVSTFFTVSQNQAEKIGDADIPDIYFSTYAQDMLDENKEAWGVIAAPLGKRANIHKFCQKVLHKICSDLMLTNKQLDGHLSKYQQARTEFKKQLQTVKSMQSALSNNSKNLLTHKYQVGILEQEVSTLQADIINGKNASDSGAANSLTSDGLNQEKLLQLLSMETMLRTSEEKVAQASQKLGEIKRKIVANQKQIIEENGHIHCWDKFFNRENVKYRRNLIATYQQEADELKIQETEQKKQV